MRFSSVNSVPNPIPQPGIGHPLFSSDNELVHSHHIENVMRVRNDPSVIHFPKQTQTSPPFATTSKSQWEHGRGVMNSAEDIWFDAQENVQGEKWFDAKEMQGAASRQEVTKEQAGTTASKQNTSQSGNSCSSEADLSPGRNTAQEKNSLTDDSWRLCLKLLQKVAEVKQHQSLSTIMAYMLPEAPYHVINAVNNWSATLATGGNIDGTLLSTAGLAASLSLPHSYIVTELAQSIRNALTEWVGHDGFECLIGGSFDPFSPTSLTIAAAALSINYLLGNTPDPERASFRAMLGASDMLFRLQNGLRQIANIAQNALTSGPAIRIETIVKDTIPHHSSVLPGGQGNHTSHLGTPQRSLERMVEYVPFAEGTRFDCRVAGADYRTHEGEGLTARELHVREECIPTPRTTSSILLPQIETDVPPAKSGEFEMQPLNSKVVTGVAVATAAVPLLNNVGDIAIAMGNEFICFQRLLGNGRHRLMITRLALLAGASVAAVVTLGSIALLRSRSSDIASEDNNSDLFTDQNTSAMPTTAQEKEPLNINIIVDYKTPDGKIVTKRSAFTNVRVPFDLEGYQQNGIYKWDIVSPEAITTIQPDIPIQNKARPKRKTDIYENGVANVRIIINPPAGSERPQQIIDCPGVSGDLYVTQETMYGPYTTNPECSPKSPVASVNPTIESPSLRTLTQSTIAPTSGPGSSETLLEDPDDIEIDYQMDSFINMVDESVVIPKETTDINDLLIKKKIIPDNSSPSIPSLALAVINNESVINDVSNLILINSNAYGCHEGEHLDANTRAEIVANWMISNLFSDALPEILYKKIMANDSNGKNIKEKVRAAISDELINKCNISENDIKTISDYVIKYIGLDSIPVTELDDPFRYIEFDAGVKFARDNGINTTNISSDAVLLLGKTKLELMKKSEFNSSIVTDMRLPVYISNSINEHKLQQENPLRKEAKLQFNAQMELFLNSYTNHIDALPEMVFQKRIDNWVSKTHIYKDISDLTDDDFNRKYDFDKSYLKKMEGPLNVQVLKEGIAKDIFTNQNKLISDSSVQISRDAFQSAYERMSDANKDFIKGGDITKCGVKLSGEYYQGTYTDPSNVGKIATFYVRPGDLLPSPKYIDAIKMRGSLVTFTVVNNGVKKYFIAEYDDFEKKYFIKEFSENDTYLVSGFKKNRSSEIYGNFRLKINETPEVIRNSTEEIKKLIDNIAEVRRGALLNNMIEKGDGDLPLDTTVKILKSFIPFYDCVNDIQDGKETAAGIGCALDIFSLISAGYGASKGIARAVKVVSITARSGLINYGLRKSLLLASKELGSTIFNKNTVKWILTESIDVFDPGVQSIVKVGKKISKKTWGAIASVMNTEDLLVKTDFKSKNVISTFFDVGSKQNVNLFRSERTFRGYPVYFPVDGLGNILVGQSGVVLIATANGVKHLTISGLPFVSKNLKNKIPIDMYRSSDMLGKLSDFDEFGLRHDSLGNSYLDLKGKLVELKKFKNQPPENNRFYINKPDGKKIIVRYDYGFYYIEGTGGRLRNLKFIGMSGRGKLKADARVIDSTADSVNLPPKEEKIKNYDISDNKNAQALLFPEYGFELNKADYDETKYSEFFNSLTTEERSAIGKWVAPPEYGNYPKSYELNERLRDDISLNEELKVLNRDLASAVNNINIPSRPGNYLRFEQYFDDDLNPWLSGNIAIGDILTTGEAFTSFSGKDILIKNAVKKGIKVKNKEVRCWAFYQIVDGKGGLPLLEGIATQGRNIDEQLYGPGTKFKVLDFSVANSKNADEPHRVGVKLQEVSDELDLSTVERKWFTGLSTTKITSTKVDITLDDLLRAPGPSVVPNQVDINSVKKNAIKIVDDFASHVDADNDAASYIQSILLPGGSHGTSLDSELELILESMDEMDIEFSKFDNVEGTSFQAAGGSQVNRVNPYSFDPDDNMLTADKDLFSGLSGTNEKQIKSIFMISEMARAILGKKNENFVEIVRSGNEIIGVNIRNLIVKQSKEVSQNADNYAVGVYLGNCIGDGDEIIKQKVSSISSKLDNIRFSGDNSDFISQPNSFFTILFPGVHIAPDLKSKISNDMFSKVNREQLSKPYSEHFYVQYDQTKQPPYPAYIRVESDNGSGFVKIMRDGGRFYDRRRNDFYILDGGGNRINIMNDDGIFKLASN